MQALLAMTYGALLLSSSATVDSLLLTDEIGELQAHASARVLELPDEHSDLRRRAVAILEDYGVRSKWKWVILHCELSMHILGPSILSDNDMLDMEGLICLIGSYLCFVLQIVLYAWLQESVAIKVTVTALAVFVVIPLASFFPWERLRGQTSGEQ